jgi:outer membrane receptor protein involved in Fe transport
MGGLVKFVTADPSTAAFSGRVAAGLSDTAHGDGSGYNTRGSINVPLADAVALRASGFFRRDPGYIDNPIYGLRGVNEDRTYGGHLALLWKPSEDFSLKLSALYQQVKADSSNNADVPTPDYPQTLGLVTRQQLDLPGYGGYESKVQAYSATLQARFAAIELTSISGYNINTSFNAADLSYFFGAPTADVVNAENRKLMQELRLSGALGEHLRWLAGGFFTHETAPSVAGYFSVDPVSLGNAGEMFDQTSHGAYTEYAVFADLTVQVAERFSVQLGGRESWIKESFGQVLDIPMQPSSITPDLTIRNNAFTYLVTPQYKLSPDSMVYARLASGYRAGGPNNSPGVALLSFKPDKTMNYELGVKADLHDRMFSIDASVYYIDWRDIQLNLVDSNTFFTYTGNAGKAQSHGVELALETRPAQGARLTGWVSWNDATLSQALPLATFVSGGAYGASGDRLPYASKWSANLAASQDIHLTSAWSASLGGNLSYVGDRLGEFPTPAAATVAPPNIPPIPARQAFGGYALVNLHAGIQYRGWAGHFFVTNLLDRQAALAGGRGAFPPFAFTYSQPRVLGFSLIRQF